MTKPRVNVNRLRETVIQAAYEWRSAEVHHGACISGLRKGEIGPANAEREWAVAHLRTVIDALHREEKSLGLL